MVKKRGEVYYLRLHVPKDIQTATGTKEIFKSLGTGRAKEARAIAQNVKTAANSLWQRVRLMQLKLLPEEIRSMVKQWLDKELQQYTDPAMAPRWLTDHNPDRFEFFLDELSGQQSRLEHLARFPRFKYKASDQMLEDGALDEGGEFLACKSLMTELLETNGIEEIDDDSEFYLMRSIASALAKVVDVQRHTALNVISPESVTAPLPVKTEEDESESCTVMLSEALELKLAESELENANTTVLKHKGLAPILLKLLGDKPVVQYVRAEFINAHKILKVWPRNANTIAPNDSVESILKRTDLGEPLAEQTIWAYLGMMRAVFSFCVESGWIAKNPVPVWKKSKGSKTNKKPTFTDEQLELLFNSPHYKRAAVRIRTPQNYWIPLIALFSGLRLNEICQLYIEDIVVEDKTLCFSVNKLADKTLKTDSSERFVPVHSTLKEIGLLDYVEKVRAEGGERLFPQLKLGVRGYSTGFGKNINKYLKRHVTEKCGFVGNPPTFHSLRSNFASALIGKGLPYDIVSALLGHTPAQKITFKHYAGKYPASVLQGAVELIDYPAVRHLM